MAAVYFISASLCGYYFLSTDLIYNLSSRELESKPTDNIWDDILLFDWLTLCFVPQQGWG